MLQVQWNVENETTNPFTWGDSRTLASLNGNLKAVFLLGWLLEPLGKASFEICSAQRISSVPSPKYKTWEPFCVPFSFISFIHPGTSSCWFCVLNIDHTVFPSLFTCSRLGPGHRYHLPRVTVWSFICCTCFPPCPETFSLHSAARPIFPEWRLTVLPAFPHLSPFNSLITPLDLHCLSDKVKLP